MLGSTFHIPGEMKTLTAQCWAHSPTIHPQAVRARPQLSILHIMGWVSGNINMKKRNKVLILGTVNKKTNTFENPFRYVSPGPRCPGLSLESIEEEFDVTVLHVLLVLLQGILCFRLRPESNCSLTAWPTLMIVFDLNVNWVGN